MSNRKKKNEKLIKCQLWCHDPNCPNCFPQLGSDDRRSTSAWSKNESSPASSFSSLQQSPSSRSVSANLVELVVVLCTREGSRRHVLKTIRCHGDETLSSMRSILREEIPSLPAHFSFLRFHGGDVVPITADQETGNKPYKAKNFLNPTPHLFLYDRGTRPFLPPPKPVTRRQITEDIIEFTVKRLIEGQQEEEASVVGMIRLKRNATLQEVRLDLSEQKIPGQDRYRFVRMLQGQVTLLSAAQESCESTHPLKAYHFAPPYTEQPEIILLTQKTYTEGQVVPDETKTRELKSLASPLHPVRSKTKPRNPRDMVKDKAPEYINAFLNSAGGVLLFGISDNGIVERVPIAGCLDDPSNRLEERVALARTVKDDIRKLVDCACTNFDPVVDPDLVTTLFVPVKPSSTPSNEALREAEILADEEIYNVIEVHVKPGRWSLYFLDCHSVHAFERRDGSTHKMEPGNIPAALNRTRDGRSSWKGGWRQLRSPFDFDKLMRKLSDPWAGREWLFAATRQKLYQQMIEPSQRKDGLLIIGSRGMGMTSYMAELALRPKNVTGVHVVAQHLCRSDDMETLRPALFVLSLAAMIARSCKEFRQLMIDATKHPDRDYIGATMLRALRIEHCENDPVDAFVRGILKPLREIDSQRNRPSGSIQSRFTIPMVVIIDAIDESLISETSFFRGRPSPSIAHVLEKGLALANGLPTWIKFIVSCRKEMTAATGPIQRLTNHFSVLDLDPDLSSESEMQQAQEDVRLFIEAFIETKRITSPNGRVGKGRWTHEDASLAGKKLRMLRGNDINVVWESQLTSSEWTRMDDSVLPDLDYCRRSNRQKAYVFLRRHLFVVDLVNSKLTNLSSGEDASLRAMPWLPDEVKGPFQTYQESSDGSRDVAREDNLLDTLAENSQGNYLYARSVMEDVNNGLPWEEIPNLPRGLDLLYSKFFRGHLLDSQDKDRLTGSKPPLTAVKPVLEVLLAATKHGITEREISHAVGAGGACDTSAVAFCLHDLKWALDIDRSSGGLPRYSLRHESIKSWLRDEGNRLEFGLQEAHGHALLAASLLQRCWPQQIFLSSWLIEYSKASPLSQWDTWAPNDDKEDVYNLVLHLIQCNYGSMSERVVLLKTIGDENLNKLHRNRTTALYSACSSGILNAVEMLLRAGARSDIGVRGGRRPIHVAASKGHFRTCELLLQHGADVSPRTSSGRTALMNAVCRGSLSSVTLLLEWMKKRNNFLELIDACQTDTGRTPLSMAVEDGYNDIAQLLISFGASVFLADCRGRTPMYLAAKYGNMNDASVRALLLAPRGKEVLSWGENRRLRTPLHTSVSHGSTEMVRLLVEAQDDLNLGDEDCVTALHEAARFGSFGHDMFRSENSNEAMSARLKILHTLLDSGRCMVNVGDVHGCTPLWYAAGGGWMEAVEALLDAGACIEPGELERLPGKGRNGPASPVLNAISQGHYKTAKLLIRRGAHKLDSDDLKAICGSATLPADLVEETSSQELPTKAALPPANGPRVYTYCDTTKAAHVSFPDLAQKTRQDLHGDPGEP